MKWCVWETPTLCDQVIIHTIPSQTNVLLFPKIGLFSAWTEKSKVTQSHKQDLQLVSSFQLQLQLPHIWNLKVIFHLIILPLPCNSRPWSNFNTAISGKENTIAPCIAPKINHHVSNLIVVQKYWIWLRKNTSKNPASSEMNRTTYTGSPTWMIVKEEFLISKSTQKLGVKKRNTPQKNALKKNGFNSFCFTLKGTKKPYPAPPTKNSWSIIHTFVPAIRPFVPAFQMVLATAKVVAKVTPKHQSQRRKPSNVTGCPVERAQNQSVWGIRLVKKTLGSTDLRKSFKSIQMYFHLTSFQIYSNLMIWGYSLGCRKFGRALEDASHHQGAFTNFDRKKLHPSLSTIASGHTKVPPMALYIIPTMFIHCSEEFSVHRRPWKNGSAVDFVREGRSFQCTEEDFRKQSGWKFLKLRNKSAESILLLLYLWGVKQYSNVEAKVPCKTPSWNKIYDTYKNNSAPMKRCPPKRKDHCQHQTSNHHPYASMLCTVLGFSISPRTSDPLGKKNPTQRCHNTHQFLRVSEPAIHRSPQSQAPARRPTSSQ